MSGAFLNQWSGAVLAAVGNSLWMAGAAVLAAWAAMRYALRMNAATRHLVWWAVLGTIVVMPEAPGLRQMWQSRRERTPVRLEAPAALESAAAPVAATRLDARPVGLPLRTEARARQVAVHAGTWPERIFFVWLLAFLVQLARIGWSYVYLRAIKSRAQRATPELRRDFDVWMLACGVHRPAQLLISREIVSPMAVGFRAPAVIVPEALLGEFNERDLDHVLLHELAHIARRDDWSNLAARLGWALLVLHPAAAWVLRQIEREREIACDDWVVTATGHARPYAASLARLFEVCFTRRRALLATGMAQHASELGDRIEMLLRRGREFTSGISLGRVVACASVLVVILTAGSRAPRWIAFAAEEARTPAAQQDSPEALLQDSPAARPPALLQDSPAARPPALLQESPVARRPALQALLQDAPAARPPAPQGAAAPRGSFLAALVAAGYGNLAVDDIIALRQNGISAEYLNNLNQSGWGKLAPQDLINLHNHGVNTAYLRALHDGGFGSLGVKDVIDLREHGVAPEYVKDVQSAGLGSFTVAQIITFREHNVDPELLRALKEEGFHNLEARDIVELRDNGVGMRNLREASQYGSSLTIRQIIRLKQAGVI